MGQQRPDPNRNFAHWKVHDDSEQFWGKAGAFVGIAVAIFGPILVPVRFPDGWPVVLTLLLIGVWLVGCVFVGALIGAQIGRARAKAKWAEYQRIARMDSDRQ